MRPVKIIALKTRGWVRVHWMGRGWWMHPNDGMYLYKDASSSGHEHTFINMKQAKIYKQLHM